MIMGMRLLPKRRDPWDRPRGDRLRSVGFVAAVVLAFVTAGLVFVTLLQPFAFHLAGRAVERLGGSALAASVVVWGVYLAAAASAWAWWHLEQDRGFTRTTVMVGILAAPIWLGAIALTPPTRIRAEQTRLINDFVGDPGLGAKIDQAITTALLLAVAAIAIRWILVKILRRYRSV